MVGPIGFLGFCHFCLRYLVDIETEFSCMCILFSLQKYITATDFENSDQRLV